MSNPLFERIERDLDERRKHSLFRTTRPFRSMNEPGTIDLSTNSYLSLHTNKEITRTTKELIGETFHGNLASRLVADHSPLTELLEHECASWKQTESALIFNTGYAANLGVLSALCTRDTEVFSDRFNHASIIDGILLAGCKHSRYRHGDMSDLAARLAGSSSREKIIVTDTIFSMDGDRAPLADICELGKQHSCMIMVDEAHATGIFGGRGSGLVEAEGVESAVDVRIGTLSKAIAGLGGFFAGSKLFRDYLVNHARSLVYSTGLPQSALAFDLASVGYIKAHPALGKTLLEKAERFRTNLHEEGFDTMNSSTQIVPCLIGDVHAALDCSKFLRDGGIIAPAIRPPTVPVSTARIRFSINLGFTDEDETRVLDRLKLWKKTHG